MTGRSLKEMKSESARDEVNCLGRIRVRISDDIEKTLKSTAFEKFDGKKGFISLAAEEAFKLWLAKETKPTYIQTKRGHMGPFLLGLTKTFAKGGDPKSRQLLDELGISY